MTPQLKVAVFGHLCICIITVFFQKTFFWCFRMLVLFVTDYVYSCYHCFLSLKQRTITNTFVSWAVKSHNVREIVITQCKIIRTVKIACGYVKLLPNQYNKYGRCTSFVWSRMKDKQRNPVVYAVGRCERWVALTTRKSYYLSFPKRYDTCRGV